MNIKLVYNKSSFNVDILKDTPSQYLFEVSQKIFRIPIEEISLKYEDIEIQNNSRLVFSVMGKNDPDNITGDEIIFVSKKSKLAKTINSNSNVKLPLIHSSTLSVEQSKLIERSKSKKKGGGCAITCQICNHKNSIFYCRVCNLFVCFECNVRFNEHKNHERINLEDGDSFLGSDVYREELINEINVIELGYQKTLYWMIDNEDRENFLQGLFKLLEQIRNNSLSLADMKTLYNFNQEILNDFRIEVDKIPKPRHREDVFEIYGNLNLKENELRNYIKFLNLQIIKTEYNKVLLKCLDKVKKNLDILSKDVKSKLEECEEIKFKGLEDVQIYIKESKLEKNQINIGNFLSKNYNENSNNINSNPLLLKRISSRENTNNTNNILSNKNSASNFNLHLSTNINTKNVINRNNNSLFEKNINKTVDKKNAPIKLIGNNIENQKKKIKKLNLDNNINVNIINKSESKDILNNKKIDISPLKIAKKNIFQIKDNETNTEKTKIKKLNVTSNKQKLSEADFNSQQFLINKYKKEKNKDNKDNKDNNDNKIIDKINDNNKITDKNKANNNEEKDNDLIKPEEEDDSFLKNKMNNDSIYQTLTSSEKKIVFNPPSGIKNNSYGKTILSKKNNIF